MDGSHYSQSAHVAVQGKAHFIAEAVSAGVKKEHADLTGSRSTTHALTIVPNVVPAAASDGCNYLLSETRLFIGPGESGRYAAGNIVCGVLTSPKSHQRRRIGVSVQLGESYWRGGARTG